MNSFTIIVYAGCRRAELTHNTVVLMTYCSGGWSTQCGWLRHYAAVS